MNASYFLIQPHNYNIFINYLVSQHQQPASRFNVVHNPKLPDNSRVEKSPLKNLKKGFFLI